MTETDVRTQKEWGFIINWATEDEYQGKILVFNKPNVKTDMSFHKESKKSWFVNSGSFLVRWIDTDSGEAFQKTLEEGAVFTINPLVPSNLECLSSSGSITQVSAGADSGEFVVIKGDKVGVTE